MLKLTNRNAEIRVADLVLGLDLEMTVVLVPEVANLCVRLCVPVCVRVCVCACVCVRVCVHPAPMRSKKSYAMKLSFTFRFREDSVTARKS